MKLRIAALSIVASAASLTACVTPEVSEKKDVVVAPPPPPKVASPKENFDKGVAAFDANNLDEANTLLPRSLRRCRPAW